MTYIVFLNLNIITKWCFSHVCILRNLIFENKLNILLSNSDEDFKGFLGFFSLISATNKSGHFAYIRQNNSINGDEATMKMIVEKYSRNIPCVSFWIFKTDTLHELDVHGGQDKLTTLSENYSTTTWEEIKVPFSGKTIREISLSVSRGNTSFNGIIAVDDFNFIHYSCNGMCNSLKHNNNMKIMLAMRYEIFIFPTSVVKTVSRIIKRSKIVTVYFT